MSPWSLSTSCGETISQKRRIAEGPRTLEKKAAGLVATSKVGGWKNSPLGCQEGSQNGGDEQIDLGGEKKKKMWGSRLKKK